MNATPLNQAPASGLVIGYGNTLRGDDGVGQRVAEAVADLQFPGVSVLARHQLTPELAEPISQARLVVFVDAAVDVVDGQVRVTPVTPASEAQVMAHTTSPGGLLELARIVFGRCPAAWLVSIPVAAMGIGEQLSPLAQRGVAEAVRRIGELLLADESA